MIAIELARFAFAGIRGNLVRSLLTLLMVVIGVLAVVVLVAIGNGAIASVTAQFKGLGMTNIQVYPGYADDESIEFDMEDVDALRDAGSPLITSVAPMIETQKAVVALTKSVDARVMGTTASYFSTINAEVAEGRGLTVTDSVARQDVAVLSSALRDELFPNGDALGQRVLVDGTSLSVVGVLQPSENLMTGTDISLYAPFERVQASLTGFTAISSMTVSARDAETVEQAAEEVRSILLRSVGSTVPDAVYVMSDKESLRAFEESSASLTAMLGGIGSVSLLVGGIGVTNVMLLTVRERTREIGVRKALGAKGRQIAAQFCMEATILSGTGGLIGIGIGYLLTRGEVFGIQPVIDPASAVSAFFLSLLIGVVFGTYPAIRAARLKPVDALRSGT